MLIQCNEEKEASIQVIIVQQAHLTSWLCSWEKDKLPQWPFGKWVALAERVMSSPKCPQGGFVPEVGVETWFLAQQVLALWFL